MNPRCSHAFGGPAVTPPEPTDALLGTARPVHFYRVGEAFGLFSNFALLPITVDGKRWPTSEHYYQAQKFAQSRPDLADVIQDEPSPERAKRVVRLNRPEVRKDWANIKDDVMRVAVAAKVMEHPEVLHLLLDTGNRTIVERTGKDYYWGCGRDGTGKNMLGVILMEIRELACANQSSNLAELSFGSSLSVRDALLGYQQQARSRYS